MLKVYTFNVWIDGIKKRISFYETNQKDADKRLKRILEDNKNIKLLN